MRMIAGAIFFLSGIVFYTTLDISLALRSTRSSDFTWYPALAISLCGLALAISGIIKGEANTTKDS